MVFLNDLLNFPRPEQVNFQWEDDEVCFVLDQHADFFFFFFYSSSSLKQQSVDRNVAPLGHIITYLVFLLNAACLAEKQHYQIYSLWFDRPGLQPTIYRTRDEHANQYILLTFWGGYIISK